MIDINNTRYHLLQGRSDWQHATKAPPDFTGLPFSWLDKHHALGLTEEPFIFPKLPDDPSVDLSHRRGAGADQFGNVYWVGQDRQTIFTQKTGQGTQPAEIFWHPDMMIPQPCAAGEFHAVDPAPAAPVKLGGLTVTRHHYLVVGLISGPGLLVFDLHGQGAPVQIQWMKDVPFIPFDLTAAPGGGFTVLDRSLDAEDFLGANLWRFNRYFQLISEAASANTEVSDIFQPLDGELRFRTLSAPPVPLALFRDDAATIPLEAIAISQVDDRRLLVLERRSDSDASFLYYFQDGARIGDAFPLDTPFPIRAHDMVFLPGHNEPETGKGRAFIVDSGGNQAFSYAVACREDGWRVDLEADQYHPMRLFAGKALIRGMGGIFYDSAGKWHILKTQRMPRYQQSAEIPLRPFDSGIHACVWHRLFLDGCIPPDTRVRIATRAADELRQLEFAAWKAEPELYLRKTGNEFPYSANGTDSARGKGTWELLFQEAQGRYLQIKIILEGNSRRTPLLMQLRCYYPRFSYLAEYLPAVFRQDAQSASFLERFLANTEGFLTVWEGAIANAQVLFDSRTCPQDFLDWLGQWFGIVFEHHWEASRKRLLLKNAITLFNQRGTKLGLLNALILAMDPCPEENLLLDPQSLECLDGGACADITFRQANFRIIENFLFRSAPGVVFGATEDVSGPGVTTDLLPWEPGQGREVLYQRYRNYLEQRYAGAGPDWLAALNETWRKPVARVQDIVLTPAQPEDPAEAADWAAFIAEGIGFKYEAVSRGNADDLAAYRQFLGRKYKRPQRLNQKYTHLPPVRAFSEIDLPQVLPENLTALDDWIQFVSLYVPTRRLAHHFTVLIPTDIQESPEAQQQKAAMVRKIVAFEKPAQTQFEVNFYWAAFRAGSARLGFDTRLDVGARFIAMQLGLAKLSLGYLKATEPPWNVPERWVVGRDRIADAR